MPRMPQITKLYAIRRFFRKDAGTLAPVDFVKTGLVGLDVDELLAVREGAYDFIALCDEELERHNFDWGRELAL